MGRHRNRHTRHNNKHYKQQNSQQSIQQFSNQLNDIMSANDKCTCGRNLISYEEMIHNAVDDIFGKSEFIPKTPEQLEEEHKKILEEKAILLEKQKQYLIERNKNVPELEDDIKKEYEECKYDNMTEDERKEHMYTFATNYNVLRIIRGFPPIAYSI